MHNVVERLVGPGAQPEGARQLHARGGAQGVAIGHEHQRQLVGRDPSSLEPARALRLLLDVDPAVGHVVAGEEGLGRVTALGPSVPHDTQVGDVGGVGSSPIAQQVVDGGVETLVRWVPRLEQVVVEPDLVDRADGGVGVGVGREEQLLGRRRLRVCPLEQLDAGHLRHSLVGDDERDRLVAQRQLVQDRERLRARGRTQYPVVGAVLLAQITGDRGGDHRVVVDRQDDWFAHAVPVFSPTG